MALNPGNSNQITRSYLDSLLIETRYMNSSVADTTFRLYGETFASPVMTAALSHLDHFMFPGAAKAFAEGAAKAGAVLWYGMATDEELAVCEDSGARIIEIIKPYEDRELIYKKIRHAEEADYLAVGIDIDHPFAEDGTADNVDGFLMKALTTEEFAEICRSTSLPVIAKGVLSAYDAKCVLSAGAGGLVLSHHNNRIEYAVPPLAVLPEIRELAGNVPVFADCEIKSGMDAFKALSLGAAGVCIGRPLMTAIKQGGADGVADYLKKTQDELRKVMGYTGCTSLAKTDPSVIRRLS